MLLEAEEYFAINEFWSSFLGNYDVWLRHFSVFTGEEIPGSIELQIVVGILRFSWNNFILTPISQSEFIILSGPFDGETMYHSSESGYIYWQNRVFKPAELYEAMLESLISIPDVE